MFTGIINNLGKLIKKDASRFIFETDINFCQKIEKGTSISVNGVCLTVVEIPNSTSFGIDVMPETLTRSMLSELSPGDIVNLEQPATIESFLSGHIVQGHVDTKATISQIEDQGNSLIFTIALLTNLSNQIVEKGSIAVNGISLTVINQEDNTFTVGIIPYTLENTMLKYAKVGDMVNIETDVLAKYIIKNLKLLNAK